MIEILKTNQVFEKQMATISVPKGINLECGMIIFNDDERWKINGIVIESAGGEKSNEYLQNDIWECELVSIDHNRNLQTGTYHIQRS